MKEKQSRAVVNELSLCYIRVTLSITAVFSRYIFTNLSLLLSPNTMFLRLIAGL